MKSFRKIKAIDLIDSISNKCIEANISIRKDVVLSLKKSYKKEKNIKAKEVLEMILENISLAKKEKMPVCQDTGMMTVFVEIGENVYIKGNISQAINQGVKKGYIKGYLRKSVVNDPLIRINTGDNTPAVIHIEQVLGDKIKITLLPKGFGAENMSKIALLNPSQETQGIKDFVIQTVKDAGASPCPPIILGIGIGGTMEYAAFLSKKALLRPLNSSNPLKHIKKLEEELYNEINELNIGPQGIGGDTTCLGVNIEVFPTHIAGLPVAVNFSCYALRQEEIIF
ncbi:MAG: fumarate hydratase [bacterium]